MTERPAKCLPVLYAQLDAAYPKRKHTLDYYKGDAAHAARKSDHNPDPRGIIHAYDVTHDPANGCDVQALADAIVESRDPRVSYMIHNRRIVNSHVDPWVWRPYTTGDPHLGHLHVSALTGPLEDDTRPWQIKVGVKPVVPTSTSKPDSQPNYRSLVGGFFSSDPFNTQVNTSIRTNNPGAINDSAAWVKAYPGYVGGKVTSMSGSSPNSTAIFETPEQGVALYYELLKRYRAAGAKTVEQIITKYGGGQNYSSYVTFVVTKTGLPKTYEIKLTGDDANLTKFAKAMWRYEAGKDTPLSDAQIAYGFALARKGGGAGAAGGTALVVGTGVGGVGATVKIKNEGMSGVNVAIIAALMIAGAVGVYLLVRWFRGRGETQ